ncbi:helix-turn-helix transcriptional regulator [Arsenophonus nasoniae]|uniref:Helix-turn-helix transcriptional regulator n=1 Tax=Arsenophonus nasoniae TaxID=638 RepID=A0AA95K298_9GAMM|nr:helix-turn-helix transcriptional regulator [Arsenophonus nasoniae]WGL96691.1 helix-turn-helix transcriptional regulator [Arsenophonus nasoniae]
MSTNKSELLFLIGQRLRKERENSGESQEAIAKNLGVSARTWGKYERGETVPDAATLALLANLYEFDTNFILTGLRTMPSDFSVDEQVLIENYRAMDEAARLNMQAVSSAFAASKAVKKTGSN